jgi:hypothetical protein
MPDVKKVINQSRSWPEKLRREKETIRKPAKMNEDYT